MVVPAGREQPNDERGSRGGLAEGGPGPADMAVADLLSAIYGWRASESAYQAARSAGAPMGIIDKTVWGPVMVLAGARWGIDDDTNEERVAALIERTGYARGRALLTQAQGLRALRRGEQLE